MFTHILDAVNLRQSLLTHLVIQHKANSFCLVSWQELDFSDFFFFSGFFEIILNWVGNLKANAKYLLLTASEMWEFVASFWVWY